MAALLKPSCRPKKKVMKHLHRIIPYYLFVSVVRFLKKNIPTNKYCIELFGILMDLLDTLTTQVIKSKFMFLFSLFFFLHSSNRNY